MLDHGDTWRFDVKPLAKIEGRIVEFVIRRGGPEIQVVALGLALEATKRVRGEVRGVLPKLRRTSNLVQPDPRGGERKSSGMRLLSCSRLFQEQQKHGDRSRRLDAVRQLRRHMNPGACLGGNAIRAERHLGFAS